LRAEPREAWQSSFEILSSPFDPKTQSYCKEVTPLKSPFRKEGAGEDIMDYIFNDTQDDPWKIDLFDDKAAAQGKE
jgi:hypothetical protein